MKNKTLDRFSRWLFGPWAKGRRGSRPGAVAAAIAVAPARAATGLSALHILRIIHRWAGGLVGLFLALVGASGTILIHREAWIALPPAQTEFGGSTIVDEASILRSFANDARLAPRFIFFPSDHFPYYRLKGQGEDGAYAHANGALIDQWTSRWARPENWLFDLHATLMAGDYGVTLNGVMALFGLVFVISGLILWWPTRRLFRLRLWPRSMARGNIIAHHRDLGAVLAPLLLLSMVTGAMLTLRPVAAILVLPFSSLAEVNQALKPPVVEGARFDPAIDWAAILAQSRKRFPQADIRLIGVPHTPEQPILVRMRQPGEWTANGRTMLWFHPEKAALLDVDDAFVAPKGLRYFYGVFPLHAGEVGGLLHRLLMTASGIGLFLLGSLAVWSFWFKKIATKRRSQRA